MTMLHVPRAAVVLILILAVVMVFSELFWSWMRRGPVVPATHDCTGGCVHVGPDVLVLTVPPSRGDRFAPPVVLAPLDPWDEFVAAHGPWPTLWSEIHAAVADAAERWDAV